MKLFDIITQVEQPLRIATILPHVRLGEKMRFLVPILVLLIMLGQAVPSQAGSATGTMGANCTAVTFSAGATYTAIRNNTGAGTENARLVATDGAGTTLVVVNDTRPVGSSGGFASTYPYTTAPKFNPITVRLFSLAGNGLPEQTILTAQGNCAGLPFIAAASNEPPPPKFFDPGDIRVDGWAGDRLAVYCPSTKQIQVIGIGADGKGAGVAIFNPTDVIAAGKAGLALPLRSYKDPTVDIGHVSIQMILNDGVTSFYIAWNGGILNATGQGDFKKMFGTPIRFCPFTFR